MRFYAALCGNARRDRTDQRVEDRFRAELRVWPVTDPPTYPVCGLGEQRDVRYYAHADDVPGGVRDDRCKTERMLLRKVPAAGVVCEMGAVLDGNPLMEASEGQRHSVMLTQDDYISVCELTQKQGMLAWDGANPSAVRGDRLPMTNISLADIRGMRYASADDYANCWPQNGHAVGESSLIGRVRTRTGLDDFDLPTDMHGNVSELVLDNSALSGQESYARFASVCAAAWPNAAKDVMQAKGACSGGVPC